MNEKDCVGVFIGYAAIFDSKCIQRMHQNCTGVTTKTENTRFEKKALITHIVTEEMTSCKCRGVKPYERAEEAIGRVEI